MNSPMSFALIICTYQRAQSLLCLLKSVQTQTLYPDSILIVDGSEDNATENLLNINPFACLQYHKVKPEDRGLTKQRNIGVGLVPPRTDVVCFLDDDTILEPDYFEQLIGTYHIHPDAVAVGGYTTNEVQWSKNDGTQSTSKFYYNGWMREEPLRFRVRRWFGLSPDTPPCFLPKFSHGRSVSFLPPDGNIYKVEHFMGGVSSYKYHIFKNIQFSSYFEGYGLYEDADFCFRLLPFGKLYVNTAARLSHHHEPSGRPNTYKYGKMVARNGWYIWRVRHPKPGIKNIIKWHLTELLLALLTLLSVIKSSKRRIILNEFRGRMVGWLSLFFNKPEIT
jgi:GT2 family glycosyltransferase